MSENTTVHTETTQLPPNSGAATQPPAAEQPAAPAAPTTAQEPAAAVPTSPHVGLIARAKENWDIAVAGIGIGAAIGIGIGALCFGDKSEKAAVVV